MILIGAGLGILYTWKINPVDYTDTELNTLRDDYQADYVLMVAEIYSQEQDLDAAVNRLTRLTLLPADQIVSQALLFGEKFGYQQDDLSQIRNLYNALTSVPDLGGVPYP
jgi:DNA-binding SARP family transcriptional activator